MSSQSHLVVIIDCSPPLALLNQENCDDLYQRWLNSIITFCNSHMMLDENNLLTVIGSFTTDNKVIYPPVRNVGNKNVASTNGTNCNNLIVDTFDSASHQQNILLENGDYLSPSDTSIGGGGSASGQFDEFALISARIKQGIQYLVESNQSTIKLASSKKLPVGECLISGAIALGLCRINQRKSKNLQSRIMLVSCSMTPTSFATQYMPLMNAYFAAQKMRVRIDACIHVAQARGCDPLINSDNSSLIKQGCDLTDGRYFKITNVKPILEYLLWVFLPGTHIRESLLLPERRKTTHHAACFCHRNIIQIGYVCSVCLSIFCKFSPICSTCQTHFKLKFNLKDLL